jgi:hypothetical protein
MAYKPTRNPLPYDSPAIYEISVEGRVDPNWSARMEGMAIQTTFVDPDCPVTTLKGELYDQAALAGVLNTLYELHLPVILVKRLNP